MERRDLELIKNQVQEVQLQYPDFELRRLEDEELEAAGTFAFDIERYGHRVADSFKIRIKFPLDYPDSPPFVWESDGRIPKEFAHFMAGGNLCLGAPVELKHRFAQHRNLLRFLNEEVAGYLFAYCYKSAYGEMPFGELDHGHLGLLFYYADRFRTPIVPTLKLLKSIADDFVPPAARCVCGSGRTFRDCHGPDLNELKAAQSPAAFESELRSILRCLEQPGVAAALAAASITIPMRAVSPRRLLRRFDRRTKKRHR